MAEWKHLHPQIPKMWQGRRHFGLQNKAERRAGRMEKMRRKIFVEAELAGQSTIGKNDNRWEDLFLTSEKSSKRSSVDSDE
jgi:hypothetical protein